MRSPRALLLTVILITAPGCQLRVVGLDDTDASPTMPDAAIADASPDGTPDANMAPTLTLTPAGNTINAVAGDSVVITASATDPDGDTLTFDCQHTSDKDPFTSDAGGAWNLGMRKFTLPAGVLGDFTVTFSVDDGHGHLVTQAVTIHVAAFPVMLNEIQTGAATTSQNIELLNTSGQAVSIGSLNVCSGDVAQCVQFASNRTIAAGAFLVVHWAQIGVDDATNVYGPTTSSSMLNEVWLISPPSGPVAHPSDIRDYVKSTSSASTFFTPLGVNSGQWPSAAATVDMTGWSDGKSISRKVGVNTEDPSDWHVTTATLGAQNN
jgi:hypothetical protein